MKLAAKYKYDEDTQDEVFSLLNKVGQHMDSVTAFSELQVQSKGLRLRAQPIFEAASWFDWVLAYTGPVPQDDSARQVLAGQLCAFVDLTDLPSDNDITLAPGLCHPGVYAIIEFASVAGVVQPEDRTHSELLLQCFKTSERGFFKKSLIPVEWIVDSAVVLEDVGSVNPGAHYRVVPRNKWAILCNRWIDGEHEQEFEEPDIGE
jgi:hypothetical protein